MSVITEKTTNMRIAGKDFLIDFEAIFPRLIHAKLRHKKIIMKRCPINRNKSLLKNQAELW